MTIPQNIVQQSGPGADNSPEFEEKFKRAQLFVGHKVTITGAPSRQQDKAETGKCVGVVKTYGKDSVDFILDTGTRYGLQLDFAGDTECVGRTNTFSNFIRTVKLKQPGAPTPKGRVRG
jgi:hypothetical protein